MRGRLERLLEQAPARGVVAVAQDQRERVRACGGRARAVLVLAGLARGLLALALLALLPARARAFALGGETFVQ